MRTYSNSQKIRRAVVAVAGLAVISVCGAAKPNREMIQIEAPSSEQLQLLPKNLSRWHLGATLLIPRSSGGFSPITLEGHRGRPEGVLLGDDEALGLHLEAGRHHYVIDLNNFMPIGRLSSLSLGAVGSMTVRSSDTLQDLDPQRWTSLGRTVSFRSNDWVDIRFPLTETRYVWVEIEVERPGEIGSLNAMGTLNLSNVSVHQPAAESVSQENRERMPYDFARLYSGARISHVSGGDPRIANFLIDDDFLTYFEFPADQQDPVFVLDLGDVRQAEYVSLLMESGPGALDVYYTNRNPFEEQDRDFEPEERLTFLLDPTTGLPALFASTGTVLSARGMQFAQTSRFRSIDVPGEFLDRLGNPVTVGVESGKRSVNIPLSAAAFRFLVVRWRSESPIPIGLRVFELSVIGSIPVDRPPVQIQAFQPADITEFAALSSFDETPLQNIPPVEQIAPPDRPEIILPQVPPVSL